MEQNSVKLDVTDSIAHISMDDGKVNALSPQVVEELMSALEEAEKSDLVILSGNAKALSAGFDLKVIQGPTEGASSLIYAGVNLFIRIFSYPKPVIAACTGHALAAGAILLMCSDLRIGPDKADISIGLNEVGIGMEIPQFLVEIASARLANERLFESLNLARIYNPEESKAVGFLDMTTGDVPGTAQKEAQNILENLDLTAFAKTKKRLRGETVERLTKLSRP